MGHVWVVCGCCHRIVLGSELRATLGALWETDPLSCYREGQVVKVRILQSDATRKRKPSRDSNGRLTFPVDLKSA